jgi:hypothetical protein
MRWPRQLWRPCRCRAPRRWRFEDSQGLIWPRPGVPHLGGVLEGRGWEAGTHSNGKTHVRRKSIAHAGVKRDAADATGSALATTMVSPAPPTNQSAHAITAATRSWTTFSWRIGQPEDTGLQTTDPDRNGFIGRLRAEGNSPHFPACHDPRIQFAGERFWGHLTGIKRRPKFAELQTGMPKRWQDRSSGAFSDWSRKTCVEVFGSGGAGGPFRRSET